MPNHAPLLVVEDEESDALLLELAMKEARIRNKLVVARDGLELIDYLKGKAPFSPTRPPALVLLDLKMPRMDGFQVLSWLAQHPEFRNLPVIVFSASMCQADIEKARQMGATDYLEKPSQFGKLIELARTIQRRWLGGDSVPKLDHSSQAAQRGQERTLAG